MDIAKFFDQTTTDCESGLAVRTLTVPAASLAPHARAVLFDWEAMLGLEPVARLVSGREAAKALASLLGPLSIAEEVAALVVADAIVADGMMGGATLAGLAKAEPGTSYLGLVAAGPDELLFGAAADGIVVCGPADHVSRALQAGLSTKLRELMGLDGRKYESTGPASLVR